MEDSTRPMNEDDFENDKSKMEEAINELRTLVAGDENLKVRMDDKFMLRYLRYADFKPKEAFTKMEDVYKLKKKYKEHYSTKPPSELKEFIDQHLITLSEDTNYDGRHIITIRMGLVDTSKLKFKDYANIMELICELAMDEEDVQKNGIIYIVDFGGLPLKLLRYLAPKPCLAYAFREEMRPWKKHTIHIVNTSTFFKVLHSIISPFVSDKFKNVAHVHDKDWTSLHKYIDPKILSPEYGGHKSDNDDKMIQYLYQNEEKMKELLSLGYIK